MRTCTARPVPSIRPSGHAQPAVARSTELENTMRIARLALPARLVGRGRARRARILRRRADDAQDEHLGRAEFALRRGDRHVRARGREAHRRPLQDPELLCRRARRRARVDRRRAARHARPHADVDGPGPELRAGRRDPRHPVPVPRLRAGARRARRADRPGHAAEVPAQGHRRAGVGRERLSPHDQQQAPGQQCPTT